MFLVLRKPPEISSYLRTGFHNVQVFLDKSPSKRYILHLFERISKLIVGILSPLGD